ncbi:hypothetical protein, partial [Kribbella deserti]
KLVQTDSDGNEFAKHEFSYFDDVRDGAGNYDVFGSKAWTVPGDGLGNTALNVLGFLDDPLDVAGRRVGESSVLGSSKSSGGGVHVYVGAGPSKGSSTGVKVGSSETSNDGVLALMDVDGDSLPDKVFRSGGVVKYRKNLSRPGGQAAFDDVVRELVVPGGGFLSESSKSWTVGPETYQGAVSGQLNFVTTRSETDRYFSDVNGDGITDVVAGKSVLFGRLGAGGVPVYGLSSAGTPAPITQGAVDTSKLFGDFAAEQERLAASFPLLDTVRRWVAPYTGTVKIEGAVRLDPATASARADSVKADGVRVAIQRNNSELWSALIGAKDNSSKSPGGVSSVNVSKGQAVYFRVQSRADASLDAVEWNPKITYLNAQSVDVNGLPNYSYEAGRDFTLGGRPGAVKAPLTGTVRLGGVFNKTATTTDDVTVLITRDGAAVFEQVIAGAATGAVPVDAEVPVTQGQELKVRVKTDSPIDLGATRWDEVPRLHYTAAEGVDRVIGPDGKPLIEVFVPYEVDMYPVNGLSAPQQAWTVEGADGSPWRVRPSLQFNFDGQTPSGRVTFTVKRAGTQWAPSELLAKAHFEIVNGEVVSQPGPIVTPFVWGGDRLFFDFSTTNPQLRLFLSHHQVTIDGALSPVPSMFHSSAEPGAFPQPYRGWGAIGYNGNGDKANQPITQSDLVVDEDWVDDLPEEVDPADPQQRDDFKNDPRVTPPKSVAFVASPQHNRWGTGQHSWVSKDRASSSRLGTDSIDLPNGADYAGTAVSRVSVSRQLSVGGTLVADVVSAGLGLGVGDSESSVDYLDMNGDGFPDVVGSNGIQYTDPTGGLGSGAFGIHEGLLPGDSPGARKSYSVTGNAHIGSAARTKQNGKAVSDPHAGTSAQTAHAGGDMPPLGVAPSVQGSLSGSLSDLKWDLADVNGDGLPDRVYDNGEVRLNLGYRFGKPEVWPGAGDLNDGSGVSKGKNFGFNTGAYGFAGGASFENDKSNTSASLADVNGDGLTDRVFSGQGSGPIRVALNTGAGFAEAVPFGGGFTGVAADRNASLGGGAYVEIPICVPACVAVVNPGTHATVTGVGRSELGLRDINGDGYLDHITSSSDAAMTVKENKTGRTNLLKSVSRPLG